ncbi:MAG: hypothetical protein WA192_19285 [Candidatus Acidiferrales bacterium]
MNNGGDVLARGARKATFPASGGNVSQAKWDSIFGPAEEPVPVENKKKAAYKK